MSPQFSAQEVFEPAMFYHRTLGAKFVATEEQGKALMLQGWTKRYMHQELPAVFVHPTQGKKLIRTAEERAALGDGWAIAGHESDPDVSIVRDPSEGAEEQKAELAELKAQVAGLTNLLAQALGQVAQPEHAPKPKK